MTVLSKKDKYPENWTQHRLKDLLSLAIRPIKMDDESEYDLITVKRGYGGIEKRSKLKGKEIKVKSQFEIRPGDFVISKRQISHGACSVVKEDQDGYIVSNEYNVFETTDDLDMTFFNYYVQLPRMKHLFFTMSVGVHIEKMLFKTNDWLKQKIYLPPLDEQREIAKILTIWDKAISLKEKLIEEKKLQKKGLMQMLLSGEKRLEGFDGDWKEYKLKEIATVTKGEQLNKSTLNTIDSCPVINGGTTPSGYTSNWNTPENTITISEGGNSCGFINFIKTKFWCGGHCYKITDLKPNISKHFLYHSLKNNESHIMALRVGSGLPNIQVNSVKNIKISFPKMEVQKAIENILNSSDYEIDLLEKELIGMTIQKKGLMQILLSGKVHVS